MFCCLTYPPPFHPPPSPSPSYTLPLHKPPQPPHPPRPPHVIHTTTTTTSFTHLHKIIISITVYLSMYNYVSFDLFAVMFLSIGKIPVGLFNRATNLETNDIRVNRIYWSDYSLNLSEEWRSDDSVSRELGLWPRLSRLRASTTAVYSVKEVTLSCHPSEAI